MSDRLMVHPLAELFPLLQGAEFDALVEDIRQHGLREPIITYEDKVLDGRNRSRACHAAAVAPRYRKISFANQTEAAAYVISTNIHRRHLNESQRAMIAAKLATMRQGERTDRQPSANLQKVAQTDAATLLNVSPRSVASAVKVHKVATPELVDAVDQGKIAVSAAAKVAQRDATIQRAVVERLVNGNGSDRDAMTALYAATRQQRDDARKAAFNAMAQQRAKLDEQIGKPQVKLGDRPVRIACDPNIRVWELQIALNVDEDTLRQRRDKLSRNDPVAGWQRKTDDLNQRATDLEAEAEKLNAKARKLRRQAKQLAEQIKEKVIALYESEHGRPYTSTEILRFQADEMKHAELVALSLDQLVDRLIAVHVAQPDGRLSELGETPIKRIWHSYKWSSGMLIHGDIRDFF
jgi:hypothetical protein